MPRVTVNEGQNYEYTLSTDLDTDGKTISAFIAPLSDPEGNTEEVGTTTGEPPDTDIQVPLNFRESGLSPDEPQYLEIILETGTPEATFLVPEEGETFVVIAQERNKIT